jgi:hypothetical protein
VQLHDLGDTGEVAVVGQERCAVAEVACRVGTRSSRWAPLASNPDPNRFDTVGFSPGNFPVPRMFVTSTPSATARDGSPNPSTIGMSGSCRTVLSPPRAQNGVIVEEKSNARTQCRAARAQLAFVYRNTAEKERQLADGRRADDRPSENR